MKRAIVGLIAFSAASVLGCIVTQSALALILLCVYAVFFLFTVLQDKELKDRQSIKESVFLYNFMAFIKTAAVLPLFLFPGAFGNIHSDKIIHIVRSVSLFFCVVFVIADFCYGKKRLNAFLISAQPPLAIATLPKSFAKTVIYLPFVYFATAFSVIVFYVLHYGFAGPIWFLAGLAFYAVFNSLCMIAVVGKNRVATGILYALLSAVKCAVPVAFMYFFFNSDFNFTNRKFFFLCFRIAEYINIAALCLQIVADIAVTVTIFRRVKNQLT